MNLEKQIKRHIIGRTQDFFVVTHPGFEAICEYELGQLGEGITIQERLTGGVAFQGRLADLYAANLHVRSAGRILMRIANFKATNFHQLDRRMGAIAWERYLPRGNLPKIHVTARHSRLFHSRAVAGQMSTALANYWQSLGVDTGDLQTPIQNLWVRIEDDRITLSLDSSGEFLYRRGFKIHRGQAPIRETLAAAILMAAGYRGDRPLLDPMCGSGTFALEAALLAKQVPPGRQREFAFMHWPSFRSRQWQYLKSRAMAAVSVCTQPMIHAMDVDADACTTLSQCVSANDLGDAIEVKSGDFFHLEPAAVKEMAALAGPGLVVLNPPYGRRLKPDADLDRFYGAIGQTLRAAFKGWQVAVLAPAPDLTAKFPPGLSTRPVTHGGQKLILLTGSIG